MTDFGIACLDVLCHTLFSIQRNNPTGYTYTMQGSSDPGQVAYLPEEVTVIHPSKKQYLYNNPASSVYSSNATELTEADKQRVGGFPAYVCDAKNSKRKQTGRKWATVKEHKQNPETGQWDVVISSEPVEFTLANVPLHGLRLIDLEYRSNGGRAYKVVTNNGFVYDMREDVLLDIIFERGVQPGGQLPGSYVWACIGSEMKLIPVDSRLHRQLIAATENKKKAKDAQGNVVYKPGYLYKNRLEEELVFIARVNPFPQFVASDLRNPYNSFVSWNNGGVQHYRRIVALTPVRPDCTEFFVRHSRYYEGVLAEPEIDRNGHYTYLRESTFSNFKENARVIARKNSYVFEVGRILGVDANGNIVQQTKENESSLRDCTARELFDFALATARKQIAAQAVMTVEVENENIKRHGESFRTQRVQVQHDHLVPRNAASYVFPLNRWGSSYADMSNDDIVSDRHVWDALTEEVPNVDENKYLLDMLSVLGDPASCVPVNMIDWPTATQQDLKKFQFTTLAYAFPTHMDKEIRNLNTGRQVCITTVRKRPTVTKQQTTDTTLED